MITPADLLTPEPPPQPHGEDVVKRLVESDIVPVELIPVFMLRRQQGVEKYGVTLGPDGRNGGVDLGQEMVDACVYAYRLRLFARTTKARVFAYKVLQALLPLLLELIRDFDKSDFADRQRGISVQK